MNKVFEFFLISTIIAALAGCENNTSPNINEAQPPVIGNPQNDPPFLISRAGAFNVGGELVEVNEANVDASESGTVWANQLLIRYFIPATENPKTPVVMMPGYGLASDIYLETPDGRLISNNMEHSIDKGRGIILSQCVQDAIDHIYVNLIVDEMFGEDSWNEIKSNLKKRLGGSMRFEFRIVDELEKNKGGKTPFILSKIGHSYE